jgi:uncharacterized protein YciI
MKVAAVIEYTTDKDKTAAVRPAHRNYLAQLYDNGQLVLAGPFADDSGALIVYEVNSVSEAEKLLQEDPFCREGVFVRWTLQPWRLVFVNQLSPTKPV